MRFGKLVALRQLEEKHKDGSALWECLCDCGIKENVKTALLTTGRKNRCVHCFNASRKKATSALGKAKKIVSREEIGHNKHLHWYKQTAERRNKSWELTKEEFINLTLQPCHYCGATHSKSINTSTKEAESSLFVNGVDRIDSSKGYSMDNCVPCCAVCNTMKSTLTVEDFLKHIESILSHLKIQPT